jgi:hypothetical protein
MEDLLKLEMITHGAPWSARRATMVILVLLAARAPVWAWGERAHEIINAAAVENLPEPLRAFFRARQAFLVEHAIDPDRLAKENAEERPHHYTEVEAYDSYPFNVFRKQFVEERLGPTAAQLQHGDSLWQIERFTLKLSEDLRRRRWDDAERDAVFTAHYAADLTQPLHAVMNYNGQLTNQTGIHSRFESDLVNALGNRWALAARPVVIETDLRARIFQEYLATYQCQNLVFAADRIALAGWNYSDPRYFADFEKLAGLLAKRRIEAGVCFVSSLWYTAWVRAGKPIMPSRSPGSRERLAIPALP